MDRSGFGLKMGIGDIEGYKEDNPGDGEIPERWAGKIGDRIRLLAGEDDGKRGGKLSALECSI